MHSFAALTICVAVMAFGTASASNGTWNVSLYELIDDGPHFFPVVQSWCNDTNCKEKMDDCWPKYQSNLTEEARKYVRAMKNLADEVQLQIEYDNETFPKVMGNLYCNISSDGTQILKVIRGRGVKLDAIVLKASSISSAISPKETLTSTTALSAVPTPVATSTTNASSSSETTVSPPASIAPGNSTLVDTGNNGTVPATGNASTESNNATSFNDVTVGEPEPEGSSLYWSIPLIVVILLGLAIGAVFIHRYAKRAGYHTSSMNKMSSRGETSGKGTGSSEANV